MQIFLIVALLIALLAVVFAVQNTALVTVTFLFWQFEGSLALVLLLAIFTGVLISLFASLPSLVKDRVNKSAQKKKTKELETRLSDAEERYEAARQELELYQVPPAVPALDQAPPPVVPVVPAEETDVAPEKVLFEEEAEEKDKEQRQ